MESHYCLDPEVLCYMKKSTTQWEENSKTFNLDNASFKNFKQLKTITFTQCIVTRQELLKALSLLKKFGQFKIIMATIAKGKEISQLYYYIYYYNMQRNWSKINNAHTLCKK